MMPDLGKYEITVLSAYGAAFLLIALLILQSWWRGRKMYRALREVEERRNALRASKSEPKSEPKGAHVHG